MRKNMKKFVCVTFALLLAFSCTIPVMAQVNTANETGITPRYSHCSRCTTMFSIDDAGVAAVSVRYIGYEDTFSQAKVTVQIQKRFLGLFWKTVDIGYANDEWVAYSTEVNGLFYNTFSVNGTGTYRANFIVEIQGTDGTVDVIEDTIEHKHS